MVWEASHVSGISGQLKKHHAEHVHPTQPINLNRHKGYDLSSISDHLTVTVRGGWELGTKPSIGHWVKRRACPCQSFLSTLLLMLLMMYSLVHAHANGFLLWVCLALPQSEFEPRTNEWKAGEVLVWCWPRFHLYFCEKDIAWCPCTLAGFLQGPWFAPPSKTCTSG